MKKPRFIYKHIYWKHQYMYREVADMLNAAGSVWLRMQYRRGDSMLGESASRWCEGNTTTKNLVDLSKESYYFWKIW